MKNRLSLVERLEYHYCKLCESKYNVGVDPKFLNPDGTVNKEAVQKYNRRAAALIFPAAIAMTLATSGVGAHLGRKYIGGQGGALLGIIGANAAVHKAFDISLKHSASKAAKERWRLRKAELAKQAQQNK